MSSLVSARELAAALAAGEPIRVLDVRWRLDAPDGRPAYLAGHIPGAVYVDLEGELAAHGAPASEGRHPLPEADELQEAARRWGVTQGDTVVVYDDLGGMSAARAWWLLSHAGVEVRLLDGALGSWIAEGLPIEQGDGKRPAAPAVTVAKLNKIAPAVRSSRFPRSMPSVGVISRSAAVRMSNIGATLLEPRSRPWRLMTAPLSCDDIRTIEPAD
jgi:3-mercaptopyruvate sulfurtransferase SseA